MIYWRTTAKDRAEWKHLAMHAFLLHFFAANILRINMTGRGREASALINSISLEMATLERSKRRWNRSCRENLGNIKRPVEPWQTLEDILKPCILEKTLKNLWGGGLDHAVKNSPSKLLGLHSTSKLQFQSKISHLPHLQKLRGWNLTNTCQSERGQSLKECRNTFK